LSISAAQKRIRPADATKKPTINAMYIKSIAISPEARLPLILLGAPLDRAWSSGLNEEQRQRS
jgi:hypothetical protein